MSIFDKLKSTAVESVKAAVDLSENKRETFLFPAL